MEVVKWILLLGLIALSVWLIVDTTIFAVKKVKEKKAKKLEKQNEIIDNNDSK